MPDLLTLFESVRPRVKPPVAVALAPPRFAAALAATLPQPVTCFHLDLYPAERLRALLAEAGTAAEVVCKADFWDLPAAFNTVILPALIQTDRELKLDMIDQGWHVLQPGGTFITLSEYERDSQIAKIQKKIFGKCGETPSSPSGMAFFSTKTDDDRPRRRHEVRFHARLADGPSMEFLSRPGTFSYGRFDNGSRAMLEVAELQPGQNVLDLGCGCGAVGCLASTRTGPNGRATYIDSNLRAIQLTELNIAANNVPNATVLASANMEGLAPSSFDVVLANPPYYGDSLVARLFVAQSRDLLRQGGRFYIVTKMPTAVVPMVFESFGGCDVIENRGYSIITATG